MSVLRVQTGGSWRLMTSRARQPGNSRSLAREAVVKGTWRTSKTTGINLWLPQVCMPVHTCICHTHSDRHINCKVLKKDHIDGLFRFWFIWLNFIYFNLICNNVYLNVCLCTRCMTCPWRAAKSTGLSGTGVTDGCEPPCIHTEEPGSSSRTSPNHSSSLGMDSGNKLNFYGL